MITSELSRVFNEEHRRRLRSSTTGIMKFSTDPFVSGGVSVGVRARAG